MLQKIKNNKSTRLKTVFTMITLILTSLYMFIWIRKWVFGQDLRNLFLDNLNIGLS